MNTPVLLVLAALLFGIAGRRLCDHLCSRRRSRGWIEYFRYSIDEASADVVRSPAMPASLIPTGLRHRPAGSLLDTFEIGDRRPRISGSLLFGEPRAAFIVHDHMGSNGPAPAGPTWW